ncbi:hypothetical protein ZWY2020_019693 [Hordeum vulgare]|nr:hypothetical protein ZWY2020_019693 [Hordeum vulgare]
MTVRNEATGAHGGTVLLELKVVYVSAEVQGILYVTKGSLDIVISPPQVNASGKVVELKQHRPQLVIEMSAQSELFFRRYLTEYIKEVGYEEFAGRVVQLENGSGGGSFAIHREVSGEQAGSLLAQEYALIRGVRGDIQYINDELCSMQAFLTNLGTGDEDHDAQIQDWAKQIRDIAYDIEDCVDDFAHRLPDDPGGGGGCSSVNVLIYGILTWFPRREIAVKIAELKNRAEHVGTRRTRYGVRDPDPRKIARRSAGEAAYLAAENQLSGRQLQGVKEPVGMADAISDLERWVKDPNKARRVLSSSDSVA